MMKHAGGEYVDAALDDAETTGDVEDQEGEAADMLGAEEKEEIQDPSVETNSSSVLKIQWLEDVSIFLLGRLKAYFQMRNVSFQGSF